MGVVRNLFDGLTNALTGMGGGNDPRRGNRYVLCPLSQVEIEAAYRSSGLMRKVVDIPALDTVREWRDWQAEKAEIELLEAEERRLGIQAKVLQAETLRGLGGGALILGAPGDPEMPISASVGKGSLQYLHVVSRWQLTAQEWIDDPTDPLFGGPRYWQITTATGQRRIHPSRVVCFRGDPLPNLAAGTNYDEQFWGESRVQRLMEAVQNSDTAQAAFASLISKARNTIVGIPGLLDMTSTTAGEQLIGRRMNAFALAESMYSVTLKDNGDGKEGSGESIDHRQVTWAGIPDIMYAFATFVAAVSDIPVTRLLGRAAEGMNSSGDSQQKDWNKMVMARQKLLLRPCLDKLDAVLIPSALGSRPAELWWQFAPLDTPTEAEEATRFKTTTDAMKQVSDMAFVPDEAFAKAAQNTLVENGWMPGLDAALADIPEDERYGLNQEPDATDPSALQAANENQVQEMQKHGAINADQAQALLTDARPRSLYVSRPVVNVADLKAWAKAQGLPELQPDLHVTIIYSQTPLDWLKIDGEDWNQEKDGQIEIPPGGVRIVEPLGDRTAVLLFTSSRLSWRHEQIIRAGAEHGYDTYQPHISLTGEEVDLSKVEPYRGKIVLGPEKFEELSWEQPAIEA